jgi:hypothetical protein
MAKDAWLPFDEVAFSEDMLFTASWTVQHRLRARQMRQTFEGVLGELARRLEPMQKHLRATATPHQHKLLDINVAMVIAIMYMIGWQDSMLPTRLLQGHNLVDTIAPTGVFAECVEEQPEMTREQLISASHRAVVIDAFRHTRLDAHADFFVQQLRGGTQQGVGHAADGPA